MSKTIIKAYSDTAGTSIGLQDLTVNGLTVNNNLTVDTNTLFVDSVNDRVGIGTISPATEFHVLSSGSAPTFTNDVVIAAQNNNLTTDNCQINVLSGDTGAGWFMFGKTSDTNFAGIRYDMNSNDMNFHVNNNLSDGSEVGKISSSGAWTIGTNSANTHNVNVANTGAGDVQFRLNTLNPLTTNGDVNYLTVYGRSTTSKDAAIGTYKHAGISAACGFFQLISENGTMYSFWVTNSGQLRFSTAAGNIGTQTGGSAV